jgi:hypothetical protein
MQSAPRHATPTISTKLRLRSMSASSSCANPSTGIWRAASGHRTRCRTNMPKKTLLLSRMRIQTSGT